MSSKDFLDMVITHMPTGAAAGPPLDAWLSESLAQVDPHDLQDLIIEIERIQATRETNHVPVHSNRSP